MKVCKTNGLHPVLLEAGIEGVWTPKLIPRIGYCDYGCVLCTRVCPSGAIKRLPLEEKREIALGRHGLTIIAVFRGWAMHDFPNWRRSGRTSIAVSVKRCALYLQRPYILIPMWMRNNERYEDPSCARTFVWAAAFVKGMSCSGDISHCCRGHTTPD